MQGDSAGAAKKGKGKAPGRPAGEATRASKRAQNASLAAQTRKAARALAASGKDVETDLLTKGTKSAEVEFPSPRGTPAPADAAPQANQAEAARLSSDQAAGPSATRTWNRAEEVAKIVPLPRYSAAELQDLQPVHAVLEQLAVLQASATSLGQAGAETASAVLAGSDALLEELAEAAAMLASEDASAVMTLMIGNVHGPLLRAPLKWSTKAVKPSTEALEHLKRAVLKDLSIMLVPSLHFRHRFPPDCR